MLQNRIILITGASSGIGAACAKLFSKSGAKLILSARRKERLEELAKELNCPTFLLPLDVCDRTQIDSTISSLPDDWKNIDILINNAGLSRGLEKQYQAEIQDWEEMIDTNIKGLLYMTRKIVPGMVSRGQGHVVNLGSIAGRQTYPGGSVYCATKAAVKAISEGLKQDLLGTPIRVSCIEPGLVETEFSEVRFHGDAERANKVYQGLKPLTADDVADVINYCITRPPHMNISEILLVPVDQASATLVHRTNN